MFQGKKSVTGNRHLRPSMQACVENRRAWCGNGSGLQRAHRVADAALFRPSVCASLSCWSVR
eukprot:4784019-Pleurochrysis_carterae.AAC.8